MRMQGNDMSRPRLGVVLIGQSPEADCEPALRAVLGENVEIIARGALDGMSRAEIDKLKPADGKDALFTRLPDGAAVTISKRAVTQAAQGQLDRFGREGTDVTLMFCTGAFRGLKSSGLVVFPSAVLSAVTAALVSTGRLGVLVPLPEQVPSAITQWARPGIEVFAEALTPEDGNAKAVEIAAARLAACQPHLIVMDCMGYSLADKERVRRIAGAPTVLAATVTARVIQELIS